MIYRFNKQFRILAGFLLDSKYKGKFLYHNPATGEVVKFNPKNLYSSAGYPGSSLWYRASLPGSKTPEETRAPIVHDASLDLDEEGFLIIKMKDGRIIDHGKTRRLVHMTKDTAKFRAFMHDQVKRINDDMNTLLDVHLEAAAPNAPRIVHPEIFFESYPDQYITSRLWFFGLLAIIIAACFGLPSSDHPFLLGTGLTAAALLMVIFRMKGAKNYDKRIKQWEKRKIEFEEKQQKFVKEWDKICASDKDPDAILGLGLDSFDWPRETSVSWEFESGHTELRLDIDLPHWNEIPANTWKVGNDGVTLEPGIMHPYDHRERYVRHIHSLVFLAVSAAFWSSPGLNVLSLSAFCKNYVEPEALMDYPEPEIGKKKRKRNKAKAMELDANHPKANSEIEQDAGPEKAVFLLSVKIEREEWAKLDFAHLEKINPVFALDNFEMRRSLNTETMILSPIEPF